MSSSSSPNSAPSPVPPPPPPNSPAPNSSSQPNANGATPPSSSPPQSPPLDNVISPPPISLPLPPMASSPPPTTSPPPSSPPPSTSSPPPEPSNPPPPSVTSPDPPISSPPPPPASLPVSSPPPPGPRASSPPPPPSDPPSSLPPTRPSSSPPPPPTNPSSSSSPPTVEPPKNGSSPPPKSPVTPTPPSTQPPKHSPPPPLPSSKPPENSPKPPKSSTPTPPSPSKPPQNSPPSPESKPPRSSPPPPELDPTKTSPPLPTSIPPINSPQPPSFVTSPPGIVQLSPPPSPPSTLVPPGEPANNSSSNNVSDSPNSSGGGGIGTGGTVAIGLVLSLVLLGVIGVAGWCIWKRKKKAYVINGGHILPTSFASSPQSDSALLKVQAFTPGLGVGSGSEFGNSRSWFTYEELVEATNGFAEENLLGEGGFGAVYKGCLADGSEVAVKQLKIGGGQGDREFRAEVEIISRIHHRHLVSLVGYCISENKRLLVYDFVSNDTLHFHLHGKNRPVMDWPRRVKIAMGAARGIAYLHEDCHPRIIHRDIKSSNILLDNNFEARVSDFGLAKLALDANTHVTTRVMGTFGYMAPEYASSGKLTEKSDVFSFGVVLLELITGRKPVDTSQPLGEESLVEWARPLLSHALETEEFQQLTDPRLEKNYVDSEMFRMIEAAAACVRHSSTKRPRMGQVVRAFDSMAMSDLTNGMRLGESEIFNSAEQSAEIRLFQRMAFGSGNYSTDFFSHGSWNS